MSVHRIRLLGPWEFAWEASLGANSPAVTEGTTVIPCDWQLLFGPNAGAAVFRRRFHCPTNLEQQDEVWLVCSGVRGLGTIFLNDTPLKDFAADGEAVECELTTVLKPFNIVSVRLTVDCATASAVHVGLFEQVALEIRNA